MRQKYFVKWGISAAFLAILFGKEYNRFVIQRFFCFLHPVQDGTFVISYAVRRKKTRNILEYNFI